MEDFEKYKEMEDKINMISREKRGVNKLWKILKVSLKDLIVITIFTMKDIENELKKQKILLIMLILCYIERENILDLLVNDNFILKSKKETEMLIPRLIE